MEAKGPHHTLSWELCPLPQPGPFPPPQVSAMQAGLLKVVPQAVLDLLTWQELEKKVCGDPEVTVDALRKLSECGAGQRSPRVGLKNLRINSVWFCPHQPGLKTSSHLTHGCSISGRH